MGVDAQHYLAVVDRPWLRGDPLGGVPGGDIEHPVGRVRLPAGAGELVS
jgi:hypothetical protein